MIAVEETLIQRPIFPCLAFIEEAVRLCETEADAHLLSNYLKSIWDAFAVVDAKGDWYQGVSKEILDGTALVERFLLLKDDFSLVSFSWQSRPPCHSLKELKVILSELIESYCPGSRLKAARLEVRGIQHVKDVSTIAAKYGVRKRKFVSLRLRRKARFMFNAG